MASTPTPAATNPADRPAPPRRRRWRRAALWSLAVLAAVVIVALLLPIEHANVPRADEALNEEPAHPAPAFDVWGRAVGADEAAALRQTDEGGRLLDPANGAVPIDAAVLALGRRAYHAETFGNEVFLTDVLGLIDGPLTPTAVTKALLALGGAGTTNLRVTLAKDAMVGGRHFASGTVIDTGIDVPKGAVTPLGMRFVTRYGKVRAGITCAACHSTVDPATGKVVHGAPNTDFNLGLMLALASNTAAYFPHADRTDLSTAASAAGTVETADGSHAPLPDAAALEDAVDARLLKWPPGSFDSMTDLVAAPTKLPHAWTWGNHPFNYSGGFAAGPFRGLSVQTNNVHGLNSDPLTQADQAADLWGIDKEVYLAILLRNAPSSRFRWDPASGKKPSEVLAGATGATINQTVKLQTYPKPSLVAPTGLWTSSPGYRVWEQVNAMAAWQDTLGPPSGPAADPAALARGRAAFERAGCAACHAGPVGTNNRVVPIEQVGTQPLRAKALKRVGELRDPRTVALAFDQRVPLPPDARAVDVPTGHLDPQQIGLAFGLVGNGGLKVPGLVGLVWTTPYLHDGGVAVGPDPAADVGVPGTLLRGVRPDPANSLRALIDPGLRARVVAANRASPDLAAVNVEGVGHEFWVPPAEQDDVVRYLLAFPGR